MRKVIVVGLGLLALCAARGPAEAPVPAEKPARPAGKWEYKVVTREAIADLGNKDFAAGLNKLGDEGWELAAVTPPPASPAGGRPAEYFFKRPKARADGKADAPKAEARNEDWEVLRMKSASALELVKVAEGLFGGQAAGGPRLVADPASNAVLALGTPRQIEELRRLIVALDVPEAALAPAEAAAQVEVLHLKSARVADVVKVLQDVYGKDARTYRAGADERTNSLVLSATRKQAEEIRRLVKELDVPVPKEGGDRKTPE